MQISYYLKPGFLSRWMQEIRFLPLLIHFPAVIITMILILAGTFSLIDFAMPEGPVNYGEFFPHGWLNGSFTFLFVLSAIAGIRGISAYWKNMKSLREESGLWTRLTFINFWQVILKIMVHRDLIAVQNIEAAPRPISLFSGDSFCCYL
jgi:hypothetical protein